MPWVMIVDSSATTGTRESRAAHIRRKIDERVGHSGSSVETARMR
ncbi:hypothetical protein AEGHOMDF_0382 [Methylobacterium soli]|nr:hypothetical protein AEGHOMDF_0382 [Methylobacterium soli]